MSDEREKLHETIQQLQTELASIDSVDQDVQALLRSAVDDIQTALEPAAESSEDAPVDDEEATISGRLTEAASHFEESHPTLTGIIGSIIDSLSRMGI